MRLPVYVNLWESQIFPTKTVFGGVESPLSYILTVVIIRSSLRHVFLV